MAKLSSTVHVHRTATNAQGHVYIEETRTFGPDDDVPAEWAKLITNPAAWEDGAAPASDAGDEAAKAPADPSVEPPKSGRGSGVEAWRAHAAHLGVEVPDDASRDDIIAAVDAHNAA